MPLPTGPSRPLRAELTPEEAGAVLVMGLSFIPATSHTSKGTFTAFIVSYDSTKIILSSSPNTGRVPSLELAGRHPAGRQEGKHQAFLPLRARAGLTHAKNFKVFVSEWELLPTYII